MRNKFKPTSQRGSALLIVLGFLSFMLISAVSFAVYMRIERQASSNYRHAVTGRHLLNAALFRAIDEIDSELRIERTNNIALPQKFPDWVGHVKPSAVPNGMDNAQESRVLSMEALSFIPGVFVNDVRRYAVTNRNDVVWGVDAKQNKCSYLGAKWRKLSMPVASIVGGENANEDAVVGRYSYICVNLSDMLNVNVCRAAVRDGSINRVGIGYLVEPNPPTPPNKRTKFDDNYKNTDKHYETLQDFYACMFAHGDTTFYSPYHKYLTAGNSPNADKPFEDADNNILVTDGYALAQPTSLTACNIIQHPPITASDLSTPQPVSKISFNPLPATPTTFQTALGNALAGHLITGANLTDCFPAMLADYIDEDSIPKQLNCPSVEMVPMISEILVPDFFAPIVTMTQTGTGPTTTHTYNLNLVGQPAAAQIEVELMWPFKNQAARLNQPNFTVEVEAYFTIIKNQLAPLNSQSMLFTSTYKMTGTAVAPSFWAKNTASQQNLCFDRATVTFQVPPNFIVPLIDDQGGNFGYAAGDVISVALAVFASVKQGTVYVDRVPILSNSFPNPSQPWASDYMATPKLYFQTKNITVAVPMPVNSPGTQIDYLWHSLEVPDPRFNWKASNWIQNPDRNSITPKINDSTVALLGIDGRDGDIYMSVSDVGRLQSPGELGFIVRPFNYNPVGTAVDFNTQLTVVKSEDRDAMFRTIRLYDHGDPTMAQGNIQRARDKIYENFTAQNADDPVAGARVNPLSDVNNVLAAAIEDTPVDYWIASRNPNLPSDAAIMQANTLNKRFSTAPADWTALKNAWTACLMNVKTNSNINININASYKIGLPDVYGDWATFGWYSDTQNQKQIFTPLGFSPVGVPANLSIPFAEIDRKMLYSFSLDSFSDRQQLFLYILRAEATVPSFGGGQEEGGMKSLAGGRAVALVWRDPYPRGFDKATGNYPKDDPIVKGDGDWYQSSGNDRISPWYQVEINRYDDTKEAYDHVPTVGNPTPTWPIVMKRNEGFHDHKILFFKQLDN